ncbi:MAG: hypothetical protein P8183_23680 [Anaerolineae bacterium]
MGFLKKLFGGEKGEKPYVDERGIYFYAQCDRCGSLVRVRADKQYDLQRVDDGFTWHKTIVDSKCFQRMQAVVHLDSHYQVTSQELSNGRFLTQAEYDALNQPPEDEPKDETRGFG